MRDAREPWIPAPAPNPARREAATGTDGALRPDPRVALRVLRFVRHLEEGRVKRGDRLHLLAEFVSIEKGAYIQQNVDVRKCGFADEDCLKLTLVSMEQIKSYFLVHSAFVPGVARTYTASTTATVTSSAGDAALSHSDPGRLSNGSIPLPQPLQVSLSKSAWSGPVANDVVTVGFTQRIEANDALRTGTYSRTLTFTLSTTSP